MNHFIYRTYISATYDCEERGLIWIKLYILDIINTLRNDLRYYSSFLYTHNENLHGKALSNNKFITKSYKNGADNLEILK